MQGTRKSDGDPRIDLESILVIINTRIKNVEDREAALKEREGELESLNNILMNVKEAGNVLAAQVEESVAEEPQEEAERRRRIEAWDRSFSDRKRPAGAPRE